MLNKSQYTIRNIFSEMQQFGDSRVEFTGIYPRLFGPHLSQPISCMILFITSVPYKHIYQLIKLMLGDYWLKLTNE